MSKLHAATSRRDQLSLEEPLHHGRFVRDYWHALTEQEQSELRRRYLDAIDRPEFWANYTNEDAEERWIDSIKYRMEQARLDSKTGLFQKRGQPRDWVAYAVGFGVLVLISLIFGWLGIEGGGTGLCPPMYCD